MVASLFRQLTTGLQDARLDYKGGDTWTQFTKIFRKTSRMTTRWHRIDFNQPPDFGKTVVCDLPLKGEFITRLILVSTLPDIGTVQAQARAAATAAGADPNTVSPKFGWVNSIGHSLVVEAQMQIGGNTIDTLDRRLLEVLDEFNTPLEKVTVMNRLLGRLDNGYTQTAFGYEAGTKTVYTPLPFWFARGDATLALPRDAISVDSVRVQVKFAPFSDMYYTDSLDTPAETVGSDSFSGSQVVVQSDSALAPQKCGGYGVKRFEGTEFYYKCDNGEVITGLDIDGPACPTGVVAPPRKLEEAYMLVEYVYVDKPEASRVRLADIQVPIVTHVAVPVFDTQGSMGATVPVRIGNPVRSLFWMAQRTDASKYNDHFSCSRELLDFSGNYWWPNASGLSAEVPGALKPAWSDRDTEPFRAVQLTYEGQLNRFGSHMPAYFRSILPSLECKKSPWVHRYYYYYGFGANNGSRGFSAPCGAANFDKLDRATMRFEFAPLRGYANPMVVPRYNIYIWAETYNVLRVFGGRASLLFDN